MRRKQNLPSVEGLEIFDIADGGRGVARWNEMVVFVKDVVPGDIADVQLMKKKKSFAEARLLILVKESADRVTPFCEHFSVCGGCKWQHLDYEKQTFFKQKQVGENLMRIGKVEETALLPILKAPENKYYRNKLEYTFSNKRWLTNEEMGLVSEQKDMCGLGFHIPGLFDKVVDINNCYLQPAPSNDIRLWFKRYAQDNDLSYYNIRAHCGFLRNVIIRNTLFGEWMVIVVVAENEQVILEKMLDGFLLAFPQITSLFYVVNEKFNDTISDLDLICYHGREFIYEEMEDLKFKIGPKSFFQTNTKQAVNLYQITREFAQLTGSELVYDLYTGTGTIANFVARQAKKVVGVEYIPEAIEDAKVNSEINGIENTVFYAGDMAKVFTDEFVNTNGRPDVVITDPPRAGMHPDVVQQILKIAPKRVVYVSCNSATQARDVEMMKEDYRVIKCQPVDMFPHTDHVESVVLMERKL